MESTNPHRLSDAVVPSRYDLRLSPDLDSATFAGEVKIAATVNRAVDTITLNAIELELVAAVVHAGGDRIEAEFATDDELERLSLRLGREIPAGDVEIKLVFNGILNDKLRGFYRSTYTDEDGETHTIATTQFESTDARRCFPCWDEPAFKAVFAVTLDVPEELLAISAMSETGRTPLGDGRVRVEFAPTPVMSTYLLAFVVGELEATDPIDVDGVPLRIVHRPGRGEQVRFAHEAGAACLRWLSEYFAVPYFGDKIDMVAIPDFASGAMENTGCITYREVLLLVDPATTTQPEQLRSVQVIAHELAHMWFGNLVTMAWWEGLWLKEAFATFMEMSAADAYRPDWKVWEAFAVDRSRAYEVDALHSTRSVEYEVNSPTDADDMYDVLTYEKGAAVVRMLEQYVGPDRFREGIRRYMSDHAFGNTVTADLWAAIESACDVPVVEMMTAWIYQPGFPVVEAAVENGELALSQRPFVLSEASGPVEDDRRWTIPVTVQAGDTDQATVLDPTARLGDRLDHPAVIDPNSHGYFRVRYDRELAARLSEGLADLTSSQRYRVVDDLFGMVLAGHASMGDYVALARRVQRERSPSVWKSLVTGFSTMAHVAPDRAAKRRVGDIWAEIAGPELADLGFDRQGGEDDALVNESRAALYGSLGSLSASPDVVAHARGVFGGDIEIDNASIEAGAVRIVAANGSRADYDEIFGRFQAATSPQDEMRHLFALAQLDDADAIADLCDRTLDGSIRSQDAPYLLGVAMANRWHGPSVWSFVQSRWDEVTDAVPDNAIGRMLEGVRWLEHLDPEPIAEFLDSHPVPQAAKAIEQHRERLEAHRGLAARFVIELP